MQSLAPTEPQLLALLSLFCAIADSLGFPLISPFADRHGVSQARFSRRGRHDLIESIGVACEAADYGPFWRCEFSAAVNYAGQASSRTAFTTSLEPTAVSRLALRAAFQKAVSVAEQLTAEAVASPQQALSPDDTVR